MNNEILNVVDDLTYLGIIFLHNGSFSKNRIKLLDQGRKAMYSMLKKCRSLGLPIDLQLKMFDTMVVKYGASKMSMLLNLFFAIL